MSDLPRGKRPSSIGKWRLLPVGSCMLLVLVAAVVPASADEAADEYNLAVGVYKQSRWKLSADAFREFLDNHPTHVRVPYAKLYLGLALVNLKDYNGARDVLRDYARRYPQSQNHPDAMYRVAECSYLLDDLRAAATEFDAFIEKYPDHDLHEFALPYYGDVLLRLNRPREAASRFQESLETHPKGRLGEDAKFSLARAYEALDENARAIELYQQLAANRAGARAAQSQMNLGALYFAAKSFDEAAKIYSQLEVRFPESRLAPLARLNAGYAYYQLGSYAEAQTQFEKAAEEDSQSTTANYWLALSHKALGNLAEAAELLKSTEAAAPQSPLASNVLFQRADCELRLGRAETALELFVDVVQRDPQGELADDSLHFAAEAALLAGKTDQTKSLLDRFDRDYPGSAFRMHSRLLRGRLLDASDRSDDHLAAIKLFEGVLKESSIGRTQTLARFHLARTLQRVDDHQRALAVLEPLLRQINSDPEGTSEWANALVLAGTSHLVLNDFEAAIANTTLYLEKLPNGADADQAMADRLIAQAHRDEDEKVRADLDAFTAQHSTSPLYAPTVHQLAELTYDRGKWDLASDSFKSLIELGKNSPYHAAALSGWAWSLFKSGQFKPAAEAFGRVVAEHPRQRQVAAEAAYQQGQSLQAAKELQQSVAAYKKAFEAFAPPDSDRSNSQDEGVRRFAFLAGLQAARVLRMLNQIEQADAAYKAVLDRFAQPPELDKLLDEWALLNYEAGRYERADEIFRRLVREVPGSDLADDARLSLAESDLVERRYESAAKAFEALATASNSDMHVKEVAQFHLVEIGVEQRQWRRVQLRAQKFVEQFPDSPQRAETEFRLAESRLNLGQTEAAQQQLLKLKSPQADVAEPDAEWFQRIWVLLAETYLRQKRYGDVQSTVDDLRVRFPESSVAYQADEVLGRAYKNQAKFDEARTAFGRPLKDPHARSTETAAKCQLMIAETYMIQEQYEAAQREYLKVYHLHKFPDWQAPALWQAGQCDEALKQPATAIETYELLVNEFGNTEYAANARTRLKDLKAAG